MTSKTSSFIILYISYNFPFLLFKEYKMLIALFTIFHGHNLYEVFFKYTIP